MLLDGKVAMIFGAGGAFGGAVAKAFVRKAAEVFLSGRNGAPVEAVSNDISAEAGAWQRPAPPELGAARPPLLTTNQLSPTVLPASPGSEQDLEVTR
jgi:NAD(P)-dependent dehydrogenase (short-subunit alcohol dehydrogenase family)